MRERERGSAGELQQKAHRAGAAASAVAKQTPRAPVPGAGRGRSGRGRGRESGRRTEAEAEERPTRHMETFQNRLVRPPWLLLRPSPRPRETPAARSAWRRPDGRGAREEGEARGREGEAREAREREIATGFSLRFRALFFLSSVFFRARCGPYVFGRLAPELVVQALLKVCHCWSVFRCGRGRRGRGGERERCKGEGKGRRETAGSEPSISRHPFSPPSSLPRCSLLRGMSPHGRRVWPCRCARQGARVSQVGRHCQAFYFLITHDDDLRKNRGSSSAAALLPLPLRSRSDLRLRCTA